MENNLEQKIKDFNEKTGNNVTSRVALDEMYGKYCVEYYNHGVLFYKKAGPDSIINFDEAFDTLETIIIIKNRLEDGK